MLSILDAAAEKADPWQFFIPHLCALWIEWTLAGADAADIDAFIDDALATATLRFEPAWGNA